MIILQLNVIGLARQKSNGSDTFENKNSVFRKTK